MAKDAATKPKAAPKKAAAKKGKPYKMFNLCSLNAPFKVEIDADSGKHQNRKKPSLCISLTHLLPR